MGNKPWSINRPWMTQELPSALVLPKDYWAYLYEHQGDTPSVAYRTNVRLRVVITPGDISVFSIDDIKTYCNLLAKMIYVTNSERTSFTWGLASGHQLCAHITPLSPPASSKHLTLEDSSMFLITDLFIEPPEEACVLDDTSILTLQCMIGKPLEELRDRVPWGLRLNVATVVGSHIDMTAHNQVTLIVDDNNIVRYAAPGRLKCD